jgi:hypothetical protein
MTYARLWAGLHGAVRTPPQGKSFPLPPDLLGFIEASAYAATPEGTAREHMLRQ